MRKAIFLLSAALALVGFLGVHKYLGAKEDKKDKPKYTIKQVMKMAHDREEGLLKKIGAGKATKKDKEKLVELYTALCNCKPPQGSADDWKKRCTTMVKAAKGVVEGKDDAIANLKKVVNCMACHDLHKPEDE
jgi:hypothetical protein